MKTYVSRRYLREKWDKLKLDMENIIDIYGGESDNALEDVNRIRYDVLTLLDAIKTEIGE